MVSLIVLTDGPPAANAVRKSAASVVVATDAAAGDGVDCDPTSVRAAALLLPLALLLAIKEMLALQVRLASQQIRSASVTYIVSPMVTMTSSGPWYFTRCRRARSRNTRAAVDGPNHSPVGQVDVSTTICEMCNW